MPKVNKAELSFLYGTPCLILFYNSTKYPQNIPLGIQVTEQTQNQYHKQTKGDNSKSKKFRVVILEETCLLILFYISTKFHKNISKGI